LFITPQILLHFSDGLFEQDFRFFHAIQYRIDVGPEKP
jgi:hypothetical protein